MFLLKWLWQIEICKLDFVWRHLYIPEVGKFEFPSTSYQKSNISWPQQPLREKKAKIQNGFSWFCQNCFLQNIKIELFLSPNWWIQDPMKSSVVIFWALETSAVSWTSAASATSLASTASTALFPHKTSWSWWFDHLWYQNDQYRSFFVELIIKIKNFTDIWHPLCQRLLRPAYVNFLKTGWWNSNFPT